MRYQMQYQILLFKSDDRSKKKNDQPNNNIKFKHSFFAKYFEVLVFRGLAELYSLSSGQQQCYMHSSYLRGMELLKQAGFPFFS